MTNKPVSLTQLTNLKDDPELSESFVRYCAGLSTSHGYKHQEIEDIANLMLHLGLEANDYEGFIYSYVIPQLNKEFDLLKITDSYVLNIELKSQPKNESIIAKQLIQNHHYLKLLERKIYSFTYVSSNNKLYKLVDGELCDASFDELKSHFASKSVDNIDLDKIFEPKNILVSPLNDTDRFLNDDYLLTENQENIKKKILSKINDLDSAYFVGLTGGPGTGKTLLLYDIAKELSNNKRVLVIHSGILCEGHEKLQRKIPNIKIIKAKELRLKEIKDVDYVLVDEAQRLYESALGKVERWVKKTKTICIFSYDEKQRLSHRENGRKTVETIENLCGDNKEKLTAKIRTNKEMANFVHCLLNLNEFKPEFKFDHIKIFYEPDKNKAKVFSHYLEKDGYQFISITGSYYDSSLDYQKSAINTHTVIGQEFDKVCMIMDSNFYYENGKLKGKPHPNPDYIFTKLLYQGLTRTRNELALIITDRKLLDDIIFMFKD